MHSLPSRFSFLLCCSIFSCSVVTLCPAFRMRSVTESESVSQRCPPSLRKSVCITNKHKIPCSDEKDEHPVKSLLLCGPIPIFMLHRWVTKPTTSNVFSGTSVKINEQPEPVHHGGYQVGTPAYNMLSLTAVPTHHRRREKNRGKSVLERRQRRQK